MLSRSLKGIKMKILHHLIHDFLHHLLYDTKTVCIFIFGGIIPFNNEENVVFACEVNARTISVIMSQCSMMSQFPML